MQTREVKKDFFRFMRILLAPIVTTTLPMLKKGDAGMLGLAEGFEKAVNIIIKQCVKNKSKMMFIGNGGSAAIASHQALDFFLNCDINTIAFNDPIFLTCMGNDFGFENIFARPIMIKAEKGDILVAISSSGKSPDILNGVDVAKKKGCYIITMSGFESDNPLRKMGDLNFYVDYKSYPEVEAAHSLYCDFLLKLVIREHKK